MLIASMIVKTNPDSAEQVEQLLSKIPEVSTHGVHKEDNIIAVVEGHDVEQIENTMKFILNEYDEVIGVFPTYLNWDEDLEPVEDRETT